MKDDVSKKEYWDERYLNNQTNWDIGYPAPAIREFLDSICDKNIRILVPGAGSAYEAEYLYRQGFPEVYVLDISELSLTNFRKRCPEFPSDNIFIEDYFLHKGKYDLIVEHTFFCAINPARRKEYAVKSADLLCKNGILAGLLFDCEFNYEGPPFGGTKKEYEKYFKPFFEFINFEITDKSIKPRIGRELYIELRKK